MNSKLSNIEYITLGQLDDELALQEIEVNLYGVVIEASFPY